MRKLLLIISTILLISTASLAQSGRRKPPVSSPTPLPDSVPTPTPKTREPRAPEVTAEKNQDYRCTDDGTLAHLMDDPVTVKGFQLKEVDTRAEILARPEPKYTEAARHVGVQGVVVLKVLLGADGQIQRIRVVRRLPYGLTENAIRAACEIKFKPALKDGQQVPMWASMEYGFSLAKSSVYGP
jgi:TonB family C-terminal domain